MSKQSSLSISKPSQALRVHKLLPEQIYQSSGSTTSAHHQILSPSLQILLPFLRLSNDFDVSTQIEEVLFAYFQEELINQIRERVVDLPVDVENYLRSQNQIAVFVNQAISTIRQHTIMKGGLPSVISIRKWTDMEAPVSEDIEVIVKVALKNYDTLFALWEMVDEEIYRNVPSSISENVIVKFEML